MSYPIKIEGKENLIILNKEGEQTYLDLPTLSSYKGCITTEYKLKDGIFDFNIPTLTDGTMMFHQNKKIKSFTSALPNLSDGFSMFYECANLASFTSDLPSLSDGRNMFSACKLKSFTIDLPNLVNGEDMFAYSWLTSFTSDLTNLINGYNMFYITDLTLFNSALPKLSNGYMMFANCNLPASEINKILTSLPTWTGTITFRNNPGASTCDTSIATSKGWTVQV